MNKRLNEKNRLNSEVVKSLLYGERDLEECSLDEIKRGKRNLKLVSFANCFLTSMYAIMTVKNPFAIPACLIFAMFTSRTCAEYRDMQKLEEKYIDYLETKKRESNKNSERKSNELIKVFNARPYGMNNTLKNQGYKRVVDSRPLFIATNSEALNPSFWESNTKEKTNVLARKIR